MEEEKSQVTPGTLTIYPDPELYLWIKAQAEKDERSMSNFILRILKKAREECPA